MGWVRRLLNRWSKPKSGPAWISPQFLGVAILLICIGTISITLALLSHSPAGGGSQAPIAQREYVGFSLEECLSGCDPALALSSWERGHDGVEITHVEPVREAGILVGYWVTFEEESA